MIAPWSRRHLDDGRVLSNRTTVKWMRREEFSLSRRIRGVRSEDAKTLRGVGRLTPDQPVVTRPLVLFAVGVDSRTTRTSPTKVDRAFKFKPCVPETGVRFAAVISWWTPHPSLSDAPPSWQPRLKTTEMVNEQRSVERGVVRGRRKSVQPCELVCGLWRARSEPRSVRPAAPA